MHNLSDIRLFSSKQKIGKRRLIIDTNLLLLLLVGVCDKNSISDCPATKRYRCDHYDLLKNIFRYFQTEIVITPHILAELSNISIKDVPSHQRHYYFQGLVNKLRHFKEGHATLEGLLGVKIDILIRFGFPDMGIIETARQLNAVIITDDIGLAQYAFSLEIPCIKFGSVAARELLGSR